MLSQRFKFALQDVIVGLSHYHIWLLLAWQDTKQRYRRSVIGPFWITISTGIMVALMGPLYGALFKQPVGPYLQYLVVSMVIWTFISGFIIESCNAFIAAEEYIKQIKLPLSVHLLRVLTKNLITLLHNLLIVFLVLVFFPPENFWGLVLMPLGVFLVFGNLLWIGLILAILCARFRDIPLIVTNLVQACFFLSPIIWKVEMLGRNRFMADFNPIYHFMEILRAPLLGNSSATLSWMVSGALLLFGSVLTLLVFSRFRSRIAYWV